MTCVFEHSSALQLHLSQNNCRQSFFFAVRYQICFSRSDFGIDRKIDNQKICLLHTLSSHSSYVILRNSIRGSMIDQWRNGLDADYFFMFFLFNVTLK